MSNEIEQVRDATTPEEMREEIFRLRHYDPLVRRVMDVADCYGMNGENRFTLLAYHALKAKNMAQAQIFDVAMKNPDQSFLVKP